MSTEPSGLPIEFTVFLRDLLGIDTFIETGTGLGRTTNIAMTLFDHVYTIEANEERWAGATARFEETGVVCIHGQSQTVLPDLLEMIDHRPSILFLDAHYLYREPATDDDCPLLEEIEVVRQSNVDHVILIDDQHVFTSVPPCLERRAHYPELLQVVDALRTWASVAPYIVIEGKCIAAVPRRVKSDVDKFLHKARFG